MNQRLYDVLIVGELNVDIIATGDVTPVFGQVEKILDDLTVCAGSSAAIFAAGAAKMGLRVLFASRVGDDLFGHFMIAELARAGVETRYITVDPEIKTGGGILLSRGQDRAVLTYLGSIAAVSARDVNPDWFAQARHLHVASPFLLTGLRAYMPELMRQARAAGMTTSRHTNWDPSQRWDLNGFFDHLDVFLPNENELLAITGESDLERAIVIMSARVPTLVVKRGGAGAIGVSRAERVHVAALPVQVADTTGAGDTFDSGFLAGWLRGESLRRALQLGVACGSLAVTQVGGFNDQPTWEEAARAIAAWERL